MIKNEQSETDEKTNYALIQELRQLRKDAGRLNSSMVERLQPFQKKNGSFKTLPTSREKRDSARNPDISVASTCTVLMAAMMAGKNVRDELFDEPSALEVFRRSVANANWGSSGLTDGNAFTTAIVVRSAGFAVSTELMKANAVASLRHRKFKKNEGVGGKTLVQIVKLKANNPEKCFAVDEYPPKTTHAYWFVDGAIGMGVDLKREVWKKIGTWASGEFHRQLIYVTAGNDALMDPPSLAMAACVINRIRRLSIEQPLLASVTRQMPSRVELEFGIRQVFSKQSDSGVWYRYFPLFHFPKGQGAADYCFSFEFLEAILEEFGHLVLMQPDLLQRIKRIIQWCDTHELFFTGSKKTYRGWNSGGEVRKLADSQSESWATATVHMFLMQLENKINDVLDALVLKAFGRDRTAVVMSTTKLSTLIDTEVEFLEESPTTLKTVIQKEMLDPIRRLDNDPRKLIETGLPVPRSALLFGPPGTSKSRLAKAIAEYLGWPLIVITPSEFLGKGLEQVHGQVDARFRDLMDLRRVVVFFDEMDALAQTREGDDETQEASNPRQSASKAPQQVSGDLDVTRQLLTTSMLPKLANLWEQKRVLFLMATNHKRQLDPAITRPNRFDLLLCVAPPPWESKHTAENLRVILPIPIAEAAKVAKQLRRLAPSGSSAQKCLDRFTVAEIGIFLHHLNDRRKQSMSDALKRLKSTKAFDKIVEAWARTNITLRTESPTVREFEKDIKESRRQYYPGQQ